ncbi:hypothetical protein HBE96_12875 [Clostridium sp. P21]|uniref:Uncharacterized protein n=1 Tax=Clostridium muellerianum TaxID=2716538 RepID=A0A7Y0EHH3_9CLOT|nr:hypothetical protein [Clostridium muellerianum]NMM63551.1 hypothetical protein [Clostridium muellerianum]
MRKVNLAMIKMDKYSTIKKLIETDGNKKRAAITLNCCIDRHTRAFFLITYHI